MTGAFISLSSARSDHRLGEALRALEMSGSVAEPFLVGEGRTPQAALISLEMFGLLADEIDTILSAPDIRDRLAATEASGGPITTTLEALAAAAGVQASPNPPE